MDEQVQNNQDRLWIKIPDNDKEISQRQDLKYYELIQEEYFRHFDMTNNKENP